MKYFFPKQIIFKRFLFFIQLVILLTYEYHTGFIKILRYNIFLNIFFLYIEIRKLLKVNNLENKLQTSVTRGVKAVFFY